MTNRVEHVSGSSNVADLLSRITHSAVNAILPNEHGLDYLHIALAQREDSYVEQLRQGSLPVETSSQIIQVPLAEHGVSLLCDDSGPHTRPIIPASMAYTVFRQYHSWSHPGAKTGIKLIRKHLVWKNMKHDIWKWTRECQGYARAKIQRRTVSPLDAVTPPPNGRYLMVDSLMFMST